MVHYIVEILHVQSSVPPTPAPPSGFLLSTCVSTEDEGLVGIVFLRLSQGLPGHICLGLVLNAFKIGSVVLSLALEMFLLHVN